MKTEKKEHNCMELENHGKCRHGYEYVAIGNYGKSIVKRMIKLQQDQLKQKLIEKK